MAQQGDPPEFEQDAQDREVLDEIARLIKTREPETATKPGSSPGLPEETSPGSLDHLSADEIAFANRLLEVIPAGIALCNQDSIICANQAFALAFGYPNAEDIVRPGALRSLFPSHSNGKAPVAERRNGEPAAWTARTRSGRRVEMQVTGQRLGQGASPYWLLTLHPASTSIPNRSGSAEIVSTLARLAEARSQGLLELEIENGTARIRSAYARASELLGRKQGSLGGTSFKKVFRPSSRQVLDLALERIQTGLGAGTECCVVETKAKKHGRRQLTVEFLDPKTQPGGKLWVFLSDATPAPTEIADPPPDPPESPGNDEPDSPVLGITASNLEILAKISHEVRTPLNSILGFAEFMRQERFGPIGHPKYRGYLDDIHDSGQHALSLINDLLDLSKIESGNFAPNFTAVDANEVLRESIKLIQPQAQKDKVVVRTSLAAHLPNVLADRRSLMQIALNLLTNAVKFTETGGQVVVETAQEPEGAVRLCVRDTGVGMSDADVAHALTPFRQLDTAPRNQDGTGLGLPLAKALAEANRAEMRITSRRGDGTRIDLIFPPERLALQDG